MVKIVDPPLISFSLVINYTKDKDLTFSDMSLLEENISRTYPITPIINLLSTKPGKIDFRINPITYVSQDQQNRINLYDDSIIFSSAEYSSWNEMKPKILEIFNKIILILNIKSINEIRLQYIDQFNLPKENFVISSYFNLFPKIPDNWQLDFSDFHIGIKLKNIATESYILRLRGLKSEDKDKYRFNLESFYTKKVNLSNDQTSELSNELEDIHTKLMNDFVDVLNTETKQIIGYMER